MQHASSYARSLLGRSLPFTVLLLVNNRWGSESSSATSQLGIRGRPLTLLGNGCAALSGVSSAVACERAQDGRFTASTNNTRSSSSRLAVSSDATVNGNDNARRTGKTAADAYFQKHGVIPCPSERHAVLALPRDVKDNDSRKGILVIGDIHGCHDELVALLAKAKHENGGKDFLCVVSVGDLVNKGPASVQVVRLVRSTSNFFAVRGNHDDGALAAALGDESRLKKKMYQWVDGLSDRDVLWLANLPYTIRIPNALLGGDTDRDTLIVHAGLVPGKELEYQSTDTMVLIREVEELNEGGTFKLKYSKRGKQSSPATSPGNVHPWASVWSGPYRVIFGHDARRGLQVYKDAIGLDTGACYGKKLTGIILPEERLVQVDSFDVYSPTGENSD